jgi:hypothetical protein
MAQLFTVGPITQAELLQYLYLSNKELLIRRKKKQLAAEIFSKLEANGKVEPGVHMAEITETRNGARMSRRLDVR